jgi:hypothetical protein
VTLTILCIATFLKGHEFLRECRRQGCRVLLLTDEKLRDADWPREAVDECFYIRRDMPLSDVRLGTAHLVRREPVHRIVALDDFDVDLAAMLREHLFIPGMGETTGRAFRDKLAMRCRARAAGIPCPEFVHVPNNDAIAGWASRVPPPWLLKPRGQAAAIGIRRLDGNEELWRSIRDCRARAQIAPRRADRHLRALRVSNSLSEHAPLLQRLSCLGAAAGARYRVAKPASRCARAGAKEPAPLAFETPVRHAVLRRSRSRDASVCHGP